MRRSHYHRSFVACFACLLLATLLQLVGMPAPVAAQITQGGSFGSAVPCLLTESTFATTCFADTIFNVAPASDPALVQVGMTTKSPLATLGAKGAGSNARVNGIGSIYGLAYDDGAVSGVRQLFAAAYTRRLTSFGPGGPGGVYAFNLSSRSWSLAFTVPGAGWDRTRANDTYDADAVAQTGLAGLGDAEISPDGRELFIVNIGARRIERYSLTANPPTRGTPISIDDGVRDNNDALDAIWARFRTGSASSNAQESGARVDTIPFALEFSPFVTTDGPLLLLGLTDTNQRAVRGNGTIAPTGYPAVHLATYTLNGVGQQRWVATLSQDLNDSRIRERMRDSQIASLWATPPYSTRGFRGWNPWHNNLDAMPRSFIAGLGETIQYPQPLLTEIEFTHDGRRMFLGLRDRTGDQVLAADAPTGQFAAIAQGDTLAYSLGSAWTLQTTGRATDTANTNPDDAFVRPAPSDYFDDNRHAFDPNIAPFHVENNMGALATALQGSGRALTERVATTNLIGGRQSGLSFYGQDGGHWSANNNTLITPSRHAGGKAAGLGDLELLCTYAFVGGRVWDDLDGDGIQGGNEPGMANVRLEAFRGSPTSPTDATAITDAQGRYRFALPPNSSYNLRIDASDRAVGGRVSGYRFAQHNRGGNDTLDSDAAQIYGYIELAGSKAAPTPGVTGAAITTPVREQELASVDIGLTRLQPSGSVGDRVWEDRNANGRQDTGEPGLSAALLGALSLTLVPDPQTATILSAPQAAQRLGNGQYSFIPLPPGRYAVRFGNLPTGYAVAPLQASGASDASDSDASMATGMQTRFVTITEAPNSANLNLDLGLVPNMTDVAATVSGTPSVLVGQPIDYSVSARNLSTGAPALSVVLVQDLPAGTSFVSASGSPARSGQRLTWNLGTLAASQNRSFSVRVIAPASMTPPTPAQSLVTQARVSTTSQETTAANNSASFTTQLVQPALSIVKTAPSSVLVGDELSFTLAYRNAGSATASGVLINDTLAPGLTFMRFATNPAGACGYNAATRTVGCNLGSVASNASGAVIFVARVAATTPGATLSNTGTISTATAGDDPSDNSSTAVTAVQRPNPGVAVSITPSLFPVGTSGALSSSYRNSGSGDARNATLTIDLSAGNFTLGALPADCAYDPATRRLVCALGTLTPGANGMVGLPITLPADFAPEQLDVTATISSATPELPADQADNSAAASASVVRPNVFVDASAPASIVAQGSVFWYTLDYGNLHRRSPALTHPADGVVLRATLPDEVTFVEADSAPTTVSGQTLSWDLATLAARQTGQIVIVVQTNVPAGATLQLDAEISTSTPGDDPADNRDSVITDVVQPPVITPSESDLRLAIHSELDSNSQDDNPSNGVYLSDGAQIAWPAGEVLDFTPRLSTLSFPNEPLPFPYEYRARVVGWSVSGFEVNGTLLDPAAADSRWQSGCRPGAAPSGTPQRLSGCVYGYVGGENIDAILGADVLREEQLGDQAHVYWTQPPAPAMRGDVYLYTVDPLEAARIVVEVEIEVWIVNAYPGDLNGLPLPEIPVAPLPEPERQLITQSLDVTLLAPRSVVGPGSR